MTLDEIREITGLPFKQKGSRFISATTIDGASHSRHDKTIARMNRGDIWIGEQGSEFIHIKAWLKRYGDISKYKQSENVQTEVQQVKRIFVDPIHYEWTFPKKYDGNLFHSLSRQFGSDNVENVFRRYRVGERNKTDTVFWYLNELGQFLHDATVPYLYSGNRMKNRGGYRKMLNDYGYTGKGVFGGHLLKDFKGEVAVVESEKSAIIMSLAEVGRSDRLWVAVGGSNKTSFIREDWKLYPDFDMAGRFWECVGCNDRNGSKCIIQVNEKNQRIKEWGCSLGNQNVVKWFSGLNTEDGDDVADFVLKRFGSLTK